MQHHPLTLSDPSCNSSETAAVFRDRAAWFGCCGLAAPRKPQPGGRGMIEFQNARGKYLAKETARSPAQRAANGVESRVRDGLPKASRPRTRVVTRRRAVCICKSTGRPCRRGKSAVACGAALGSPCAGGTGVRRRPCSPCCAALVLELLWHFANRLAVQLQLPSVDALIGIAGGSTALLILADVALEFNRLSLLSVEQTDAAIFHTSWNFDA